MYNYDIFGCIFAAASLLRKKNEHALQRTATETRELSYSLVTEEKNLTTKIFLSVLTHLHVRYDIRNARNK